MHPFSTPWKHQKTRMFSGVSRGQGKSALRLVLSSSSWINWGVNSLFFKYDSENSSFHLIWNKSNNNNNNWSIIGQNKINKILVKLFKNGSSKICGRQPLNNLKWYGPYHFKFFKGYLTKFFLVHSWIPWLIYDIHNNWK